MKFALAAVAAATLTVALLPSTAAAKPTCPNGGTYDKAAKVCTTPTSATCASGGTYDPSAQRCYTVSKYCDPQNVYSTPDGQLCFTGFSLNPTCPEGSTFQYNWMEHPACAIDGWYCRYDASNGVITCPDRADTTCPPGTDYEETVGGFGKGEGWTWCYVYPDYGCDKVDSTWSEQYYGCYRPVVPPCPDGSTLSEDNAYCYAEPVTPPCNAPYVPSSDGSVCMYDPKVKDKP